MITALEKSIKFIKSDSQGESGIKIYNKVSVRIKLPDEDKRVVIGVMYKDKMGRLLLVANLLVDYKNNLGIKNIPL